MSSYIISTETMHHVVTAILSNDVAVGLFRFGGTPRTAAPIASLRCTATED
jgi:hypothetical protein